MRLVCTKRQETGVYDVDKPYIVDKRSTQSFGDKRLRPPSEPEDRKYSVMLLGCEPAASKQIAAWLLPKYRVRIDDQPDTVILRRSVENVAVVICEESLATDRSGLTLLAELNKLHHLVQPILFSVSIGEELLMYAVNEIGALKYLRKPLDRNELLRVVSNAVEMHRQALDIEAMRKDHQALLSSKHGMAYRQRQLQRRVRIALRFSRDILLASTATMLTLQAILFGVTTVIFIALYLIKRALGLDLIDSFHLHDLISG